jgi:two-component system cell cycle response regulator
MYLLQAFGHEISGTKDGAEGIEMARQGKPDLILLDIHMPRMDGYEVARRLREDPESRGIQIVAVTALAMVGDREKLLASGFDGYISKPIEPETFSGKVQGFLRLPARSPESSPTSAPENEQPFPKSSDLKHTVLLFVDNSAINLQLARSILAPQGYEVVTAPNVQEGMALARRSNPDMIVSDIHMPHQDGFDFIRLVRADSDLQQIPFVFLSSSIWSQSDQEKALAHGAVKFLSRPIEAQQLAAELETCLRGRTTL